MLQFLTRLFSFLSMCLVVVPLLGLFAYLFSAETVAKLSIWGALSNTLVLCLAVGCLSGIIGVSLAGLVVFVSFPFKRLIEWLLVVPLAIPSYVMAFVFVGVFKDRSVWMLIVVLTLSLYPYVYLLSRQAFLSSGGRLMEVSRSLGLSSSQCFFRVLVPFSKPWIFSGMMLVMLEVLADFGAVSLFNMDTLTTQIYLRWFGLFSFSSAAKLACVAVLVALLAVSAEGWLRSKQALYRVGSASVLCVSRLRMSYRSTVGVFLLVAIIVLAVGVPLWQLTYWSFLAGWRYAFDGISHSLITAGLVGLIVVLVSSCLVFQERFYSYRFSDLWTRLSLLGYGIPGPVLAVALFGSVIGGFKMLGIPTIWISRSLVLLLVGLSVRYLSLGYRAVVSNMGRLSPSLDDVCASLDVPGWLRYTKIYLPLLKPGAVTGFIIVFVDVVKEMPLSLMLRPFGWDTLSVKVFSYSAEGLWIQAAVPSLVIVGVGLIPVWFLMKRGKYE